MSEATIRTCDRVNCAESVVTAESESESLVGWTFLSMIDLADLCDECDESGDFHLCPTHTEELKALFVPADDD